MKDIRNVAIIAHVDHGKTTLVDKILIQTKLFKDYEKPGRLIMDINELERERGITILAKNVAVQYENVKINIIDTPGHSDFGGEVERILNMADGVILLVDAFEGTMPQTRFVLQKSLSLGLKPIVVINKVDKPNCRPEEVQEQVFDLMCSLNATEEQLDFPTLYGSAKQGWMSNDWARPAGDIIPLLDAIIDHIPAPKVQGGSPQLLISSMDYSNYLGRIAIGRLQRGELTAGMNVSLYKKDGSINRMQIKALSVFEGLAYKNTPVVTCGDICALVGIDGFNIGDTITDYENPEPLETITVDEPTMSMLIIINDSPFFGKDGIYLTSRHLKERLEKELEKNLALRMEPTDSADAFIVFGRGILHLSILIETMRREGYEFQVGQPRVVIKKITGEPYEPFEILYIDLPLEYSGKIIEMITARKGTVIIMERREDRMHFEFEIPSRGIIGLRNNVLTATAGEAVLSHRFKGFQPWAGHIDRRINGSLIAMESGKAYAYSIDKLKDRGRFFIGSQEAVYAGQVVGEHCRTGDLVVNVARSKKLTNMRASGSDEKIKLTPPLRFSLEEALEYIQEDEYVEVTPHSMRLRKILLKANERKIAGK
ncbi:MAG: translational GTPase TypA [Bacteroidales bacterium]|nr:translational GTPase TypA [Bacteroidales bacterium]